MAAIEISRDYGYVIVTGIASVFMTTYLGVKVGTARKKAMIPYPFMYATQEESEKDQQKMIFNCYQRAHQNTLEAYPQFLFTLLIGGLKYPILSSIGGGIYILGRLAYAWGYQTGDPSKRRRGVFGYIGTLILSGTSIATAVSLLT